MFKDLVRSSLVALGVLAAPFTAKADITDGKFSINQIFDVQYYWSQAESPTTPDYSCYGTNTCEVLHASNFIAPYDKNFQTVTATTGQYFKFFNSTTNPGTYGLGLYNADGTLAQVVHDTGSLTAIGPNAIFYIGSGFFGTVISTGAGYNYGQGATFSSMDTTVTATEASSYTWASTTPLAAGQTAPPPAPAFPVANADFGTGTLSGWTAGGGTGTQPSTSYGDNGVGVAVVQEMTSYTAGGSPYKWTVKPPTGTYMASIQPNSMINTGNTFNDMIADLGLSQASKNEIIAAMVASGNGQPTNAAWIYQDITLSNGQTFKMAWQYISTDYVPFNDGSLTSLVNRTGTVVAKINGENKEYALLGFTNPGTGNYSVGSYGATGWQLAEYTANEAGTYRLGFAAFNLSDTALSPILFVTQNVGQTLNFTTPFGAIAPNPGSSAPNNNTGPSVVSTGPGTPIVTNTSVNGTPVTTSITNTNLVNGVDANGNPTVTTYFTVTTTTVTPVTTTTVTTPVTVTTYSDGSTTTANGTPVTTVTNSTTTAVNTTPPAVQSVATSVTEAYPTVYAESVVYWQPTSTTGTNFYKMAQQGAIVTINKNVTTIVAQPITTTVIGTTPITTFTTTVDGNGVELGKTSTTINQVVSNTYDSVLYSVEAKNEQASANIGGLADAIKISRTNPFLIDPLEARSDNWISPGFKYYSTKSGQFSGGSMQFGKQMTGSDGVAGVAFEVSKAEGSGYLNSDPSVANAYAGTAYMLYKGEPVWIKAAIGGGYSEPGSTTKIPQFGLINSTKAKQTLYYADAALYSAADFNGLRPYIGATVVNSQVYGVSSTGTPLLAPMMPNTNTTQVLPYAGVRYEPTSNLAVDLRATQTPDFGTVGSARVTYKKEVVKNVFVNASVGGDIGSKGYKAAVGTVGLTWKF